MQASIIISYYNNIPNLELILAALDRQTAKSMFEVIISEDADMAATVEFITKIRPSLSFPLLHISQQDKGFRKCKALNKAIVKTNTEFIIFIDGDCIPHEKFVEEYLKEKKDGFVLYGRRVMLSKKISDKLHQTKDISLVNLFTMLFTCCTHIEEGLYFPFVNKLLSEKENGILLGCNMAMNKKDILAINGFDEDYESPGGGEDTDIEWRFKASGNIKFKTMKFRAIVYHLYHTSRFLKEHETVNVAIVENKKRLGYFFCKNGIEKLL